MNSHDYSSIERHCRELRRCNQRGGRMLSIFDLLDAGSLDLDLAAFLTSRITLGASFMVGALPGGAGKTTVMCALLNFLHPETEIVAATPEAMNTADTSSKCYVCHEIGAGNFFAYLWDNDLRTYCRLIEQGHQLATNLHANDLPQARAQLVDKNGVAPELFTRFELMIFLRVSNDFMGPSRRVEKAYLSDGVSPHTLIYKHQQGLDLAICAQEDPWRTQCRAFLETEYRRGTRTIEDVRQRFVEFVNAL